MESSSKNSISWKSEMMIDSYGFPKKIPKREALGPVWPGCLWIQQYLINAVIVSFVFFLYLRIWHMGMSFFISLNKPLLEYTPHIGSFWQFVICCIYVIVYFIFVFVCLTNGNINFWIPLNNPLFKNIPHIGSFWHFVICCICVFVFVYLCMRHLVMLVLISLDQELS